MLPIKPHQTPNQCTNLNLFNNCEVYYEINIFKQTNKKTQKTHPAQNHFKTPLTRKWLDFREVHNAVKLTRNSFWK